MSVDLIRELDREHLDYELIPHRRTETAMDEAEAVGTSPGEVAKTIVLTDGDVFVRAVLPASERVDLRKVRLLVGRKRLRLATESELVLAYPMFELGAVPPVGGPLGDRVVVDGRVAAREDILLEPGSHSESLRLRARDLLVLARAQIGDICRK